ncbi:MAG: hypothetical protein D6795_01365 [Deltaproteobacteria bacterium]|nr:MAG: hypothetical protein D6795_01365 [Deltaproteobacteria bacterium]
MRNAPIILRVVLLVTFTFLCRCSAPTRHRVLSFFFDGVPPLSEEEQTDRVEASNSEGTVRGKETPGEEVPRPSEYILHPPFLDRRCTKCHLDRFGNQVDRTSKLCFRCHSPQPFEGEVVHAPVANGACVLCHDPHKSKIEHLLKAPERELCAKCHAAEKLAKTKFHIMAEERSCTSCHDPHRSEGPALLHASEGGGVCMECHASILSNLPRRLTHPPAREGHCMKCHQSHNNGQPPFLVEEGNGLCRQCHAVPSVDAEMLHGPVMTDCIVCHDPHGSNIPFNLKETVPQLCWRCHEERKIAGWTFEHLELDEKGCLRCHDPHGTNLPAFLVEGIPGLCMGCHPPGEKKTHVRDQLDEGGRCLECHAPHGGQKRFFLREASEALQGAGD